MKKVKKIVAALLGICMAVSGFTLAACKKDNEPSDSNTDNTTDNTPEEKPEEKPVVTTVANAEEWKAAFDIFSLDSFTCSSEMVSSVAYSDGSGDYSMTQRGEGTIDVKNYKFYSRLESVALNGNDEADRFNFSTYGEYGGEALWLWHIHSTNPPEKEVSTTPSNGDSIKQLFAETVSGFETIFLLTHIYDYFYYAKSNMTEGKTLSEFYSEFTYKDGCYVSETLTTSQNEDTGISMQFKVWFINGVISKFECSYGYEEEVMTEQTKFTVKIHNVNKTVVQTPESARAAIDAEKAKG